MRKSSPGSRNHKDQPGISNSDLLNERGGREFYPCVYVREANMSLSDSTFSARFLDTKLFHLVR